jgi:flagellar assembly protein FliH
MPIETFVYHTPGIELQAEISGSASKSVPMPQPDTRVNSTTEQDVARLVSEARADGERHARTILEEEILQQRQRVTDAVSVFDQERKQYYASVEVEMVHFALAIAARILHRESLVDPMVVAGLVHVAIGKLQQNAKVIVRVRPDEAQSWRKYFHSNDHVEILEDPSLNPKDCKLETEVGIAEMGLDSQLKEIEQGFFDLLAQRPAK